MLLIAALIYGYLRHFRSTATGEPLNISCFVFRDMNRNGRYDLGDRPYAGMRVVLKRPEGQAIGVVSNISGFANFRMARPGISADITAPGAYGFTATPPQGWAITSANGAQTTTFKTLAASPAGIVAEKTCAAIGVAPDLTITGRVARGPTSVERIIATSPAGQRSNIRIQDSGAFAFVASTGVWQLEYVAASGQSRTRAVRVSAYPVIVSGLAPEDNDTDPLGTQRTVGFDDLTGSDTLHEVPGGYAGLNWTNWVATHQKFYAGAGYVNGTVSSEYMAYNSSGHPAAIGSDTPFDLVGLHVGVAWPAAEQHDIVIRAWRQQQLIHEDRIRARVAGPVHFAADYRNVTRIEFSSDAYWQFVIDDLVIRTR